MLLTYKYKLYKTKKTKYIDELINIACCVYNHCIALHKRHYRIYGKSLNKLRLQKHITKLKRLEKYKEWNNLGSQAIQQITERIDNAYKKFFKKQGGLSSFKKRIKYKSFSNIFMREWYIITLYLLSNNPTCFSWLIFSVEYKFYPT